MLFFLPANVGLYAKFGFQLIQEPAFAQQPSGMIEIACGRCGSRSRAQRIGPREGSSCPTSRSEATSGTSASLHAGTEDRLLSAVRAAAVRA